MTLALNQSTLLAQMQKWHANGDPRPWVTAKAMIDTGGITGVAYSDVDVVSGVFANQNLQATEESGQITGRIG